MISRWIIPLGTLIVDRISPPADPPAYTLLYTVTLVLVLGTASYLAFKKIRNWQTAQMPDA